MAIIFSTTFLRPFQATILAEAGRIGAFELASGVTLRKGVAKGVDAETLKKAAIKDGYVTSRDQGMNLVLNGVTSLEGMQRIFSSKKKSQARRSKSKA